jgi:hypothetical protein
LEMRGVDRISPECEKAGRVHTAARTLYESETVGRARHGDSSTLTAGRAKQLTRPAVVG